MCQLREHREQRCPAHLESTRLVIAGIRALSDHERLSIQQMQLVFAETRGQVEAGWVYPTLEERNQDFALLVEAIPALNSLDSQAKDQIDDITLKAYLNLEQSVRQHQRQLRHAVLEHDHAVTNPDETIRAFYKLVHQFERYAEKRENIGMGEEIALAYINNRVLPHPATLAAFHVLLENIPTTFPALSGIAYLNIQEATNGRYVTISRDESLLTTIIKTANNEAIYISSPRSLYEEMINPDNPDLVKLIETSMETHHAQIVPDDDPSHTRTSICAHCGQRSPVLSTQHDCPAAPAYGMFSTQEVRYLETRNRRGVSADDIATAFCPVIEMGEPVAGFRSVDLASLSGPLREIAIGLADVNSEVLHRANAAPAHTAFRDRVLRAPSSINGITVAEVPLSQEARISKVNTTVRSQFGSYLDGSAPEPREFVNYHAALRAFHDPQNRNRQFIHVLLSGGLRYFLGTMPRGVVLRNNRQSIMVRQRFNNVDPDNMVNSPYAYMMFMLTPIGLRYSLARSGATTTPSIQPLIFSYSLARSGATAPDGDVGAFSLHTLPTQGTLNAHTRNTNFEIRMNNFDNAIREVLEGRDGFLFGEVSVLQRPSTGVPHTSHSVIDAEGRHITLHSNDGPGVVTFQALAYKNDVKGLILEMGCTMECSCPAYGGNYYCAHTQYVNAVLQTALTDLAMRTVYPDVSYDFTGFDIFKPIHPGITVDSLIPFGEHIDTQALQVVRRDHVLSLETRSPIFHGTQSHPVRYDIPAVVNDSALSYAEKIARLEAYQSSNVYEITRLESLRAILQEPDTQLLLQTSLLGRSVNLTVTSMNDRLVICRETVACPLCTTPNDQCDHTVALEDSLSALERVLNSEMENNVEQDAEYKQLLIQELSTLRRDYVLERHIQNIMTTRGISREEAVAIARDHPTLPIEDLIVHAQIGIDERASANPSLADYRDQLNNDNVLMTRSLADYVGVERAQNMENNNLARSLRWHDVEAPMAFEEAREAVTELQTARESAYTVTRESGVTDGICDPANPSPLGFGIEIEFDLANDRFEVEEIQEALYHEGLATREDIGEYHDGANSGWEGFNIEDDGSVDGELVTPILYDTPEDWSRLNRALEVLLEHGAVPTMRTGGHINISTHNLAGNNAKHVELARLMVEHEDALFRIASDPSRGSHRGRGYCSPVFLLPEGDVRIDHKRIIDVRDSRMINNHALEVSVGDAGVSHAARRFATRFGARGAISLIESLNTNRNARAEFRLWDGSLNLGTIQTQVAISAAMVDYADRKIEEDGYSKSRTAEHNRQYADGNDGIIRSANDLSTKLFRKREDRERLLTLLGTDRLFRQ